ncbi:MAG: nucleotidyltransferase family protein [Eubacterium sp.]|nr:nucleotidyltransferase family protein [Eubacterium sp.]
MNTLQTTIFNLIDAALHQKTGANNSVPQDIKRAGSSPVSKATDAQDTDWDAILTELENQAVIGIPLEYMINNTDAPQEQKDHWTNIVYSQVAQWTKIIEAQNDLIQLLNKNGIKLAIIKGITAAMNYPKPDYRSMGDVDFFVDESDFNRTYELMTQNGYSLAGDESIAQMHVEKEKYHHIELMKNGVTFELHRRMSDTVQGKETDQKIEAMIQEGMNHIEIGRVGTYEFPMFEKKLNGLIILRHIIQHIGQSKGVGLRHVIDWMTFVEKNVDDDAWRAEFESYLDAVDLKVAAIVFARIGQLYLGMDESIEWCKGVVDDENAATDVQAKTNLDTLCQQWIEQIMEQGNFGKKQTEADQGASVLYKNKNIFTMIGSLQGLGMQHWEAARKHKALRPLAWAYQAGRYARKGLGRKNPIKSLKSDMDKSNYKKELLKGLKID